MFNDYLERFLADGVARFYTITVGGGLLLLMLSGWLYWHYQYLNPQTVFWGAVSNNLSTTGVTKHTSGNDNNGLLDQYDQISLGANNFVSSTATITQNKNSVTSQTIGTPQANFARYTNITADKPTNFGSVLNQWSKQDLDGKVNSSLADAVFDVLPIADLTASQRQQVLNDIHSDGTYTVDFTSVGKQRKDGHLYYEYNLTVAPDKYVKLLKEVDDLMGLNQLKNLDPAQYQGGQPIQFKVSIDAPAHQLISVLYAAGRQETYSAWGVTHQLDLPTNTISQSNLQTKLSAILNGQ